jgi:hypothetical protein
VSLTGQLCCRAADPAAGWHEIDVTPEDRVEFRCVLYLQLRVIDAACAEELQVAGGIAHRPLGGSVRYFAVEAIMFNDMTETLLLTKDEAQARRAVQRLAAVHGVPIRRHRGPGPALPGY